MREHFLCIVKWENGFGAPHIGVCVCASLFAAAAGSASGLALTGYRFLSFIFGKKS